jgi:diguanylate cyclase (GGDEF)-like protein
MLVTLISTIVFLPILLTSMVMTQVNLEHHWQSEKRRGRKPVAFYYIPVVFIAQELAVAIVTHYTLGVISFMFTIPSTMLLRNQNRSWWALFALAPFITISVIYSQTGQLNVWEFAAQFVHIIVLGLVCWGLNHVNWRYVIKYSLVLFLSSLLHFLLLISVNQLTWRLALEILLGTGMVVFSEVLRRYLEVRRYENIAKLQYESVRDDLTGLLNFRAFSNKLEDLIENDSSLHQVLICALDIDHFKYFNDTFGHFNGNRVLRAFSQKLRTDLHEAFDPGCAVYRFGGDEFMAVLTDADEEELVAVLDKIEDHFSKNPVQTATGDKMGFTFSCGIAKHIPGESYQDTLKRADERIYEVKKSGRGFVLAEE